MADHEIVVVGGPALVADLVVASLRVACATWSVTRRDVLANMARAPDLVVACPDERPFATVAAWLGVFGERFPACPLVALHRPDLGEGTLEALAGVNRGATWLSLSRGSGDLLAAVAAALPDPSSPNAASRLARLTPRERHVLSRLSTGKPNKVIAYEISCSESTVKIHLGNMMRKLGARNRTELALMSTPRVEAGAYGSSALPCPLPLPWPSSA